MRMNGVFLCIHLDVRCSYGGQAVPGLFHFTLVAAENALRVGLNVLRNASAI